MRHFPRPVTEHVFVFSAPAIYTGLRAGELAALGAACLHDAASRAMKGGRTKVHKVSTKIASLHMDQLLTYEPASRLSNLKRPRAG
jgi:hypothetical protein